MKYTRVIGAGSEGLIRRSLSQLGGNPDPACFWRDQPRHHRQCGSHRQHRARRDRRDDGAPAQWAGRAAGEQAASLAVPRRCRSLRAVAAATREPIRPASSQTLVPHPFDGETRARATISPSCCAASSARSADTAINIAGLALGFALRLPLGLFLHSELTYDRHYPNHRNIYRVANEVVTNGRGERMAVSADAIGPMLADEYRRRSWATSACVPSARATAGAAARPCAVRTSPTRSSTGRTVTSLTTTSSMCSRSKWCTATARRLLQGSGIAISQRVAKKYFGDENPSAGRLATDLASLPGVVTLVFRDQPANTT